MTARGRRTAKQLEGVPSSDMTRGEYDRSNDDKTYVVTRPNGTLITVTGIHSARAVAGKDGSYEEEK